LSACETAGTGFVVVLGEPDYYRRFGFQTASLRGITNAYGVVSMGLGAIDEACSMTSAGFSSRRKVLFPLP
jgi:predicted N-acetyltransferase YhbS